MAVVKSYVSFASTDTLHRGVELGSISCPGEEGSPVNDLVQKVAQAYLEKGREIFEGVDEMLLPHIAGATHVATRITVETLIYSKP